MKTTKENVESRLPRSEEGRANYEAKLAQVRGDEANKLIQRGQFTRADKTMARMTIHLKRCANYAGISVTADPVEMPFKPSPHMGRDNARKLELTPEERARVKRFLRQSDLGYRLFIDATLADSPVRRPFIIVPVQSYETGR